MKAIVAALVLLGTWSAQASELRIIETSETAAQLMLELHPDVVRSIGKNTIALPDHLLGELSAKLHELSGHCGGFMDITDEGPRKVVIKGSPELPELEGKRDWIVTLVDEAKAQNIRAFVAKYSGQFKTRFARSEEGQQAPKWLQAQWQAMADEAGRTDIKVQLLPGPSGIRQNSVRITIPGQDENLPIVVLGAHLDSINRGWGSGDGDSAPGADDDASGIAALTEAYRVMLAHKVRPHRTIQIFGYAAEELGLLGSRVVAEHYQSDGIKVRGVLQLDMVAFPSDSHSVTFMTDYVDKSLTLWTEQVYGLYVGGTYKEDRCGYGCSDHASWSRYGYPSVMPFETPFNEMNGRIHTDSDLWDEFLDAEYASRFTKLALAFTAEMSR